MEEEKYGLVPDSELEEVILRFENMRKSKGTCYFDVIEFETIIDYYLDSNNPAKAFEAMSFACELHPNSVPIQIRKARVLIEKGKAVEALSIIKRIENIEPGNYEISICKGTALAMLGDLSGAQRTFNEALESDAEDQETILYSITSVLQDLNYYEQTIPYLLRLADREPDFAAHVYDLAYAFEKKGDYEKSIIHYCKYLEEEPNSDSAWYNLGIIYNKTGDYENALNAYDYALAINPSNTFALFNKANILSNLERYKEAMEVYREFVEEEPESLEGLTYLAECYDKTGNEEMAKKYYFEAIELAPEFPDPWYGLGLLSLSRQKATESIPLFRKAIQLDNTNAEYWFTLGKAYIMLQELKMALKCFRETLKLDSYFDEAWIETGMIIMMAEAYDKALAILEQAKKICGNVPGIYYLLASCYLHVGRTKDAMCHLSRAASIDPDLFGDYAVILPDHMVNDEITNLFKRKNNKE